MLVSSNPYPPENPLASISSPSPQRQLHVSSSSLSTFRTYIADIASPFVLFERVLGFGARAEYERLFNSIEWIRPGLNRRGQV